MNMSIIIIKSRNFVPTKYNHFTVGWEITTHGVRVDQHVDGVEVEREGDLPGLQLLEPVLEEQGPEVLVEGAAVRQEGRAHHHVTNQSAGKHPLLLTTV